MAIMLVLLLAGLAPTANYNWKTDDFSFPYKKDWNETLSVSYPTPADHAKCYWGIHVRWKFESVPLMIVSILLLGLGFLTRVVRLHNSLSKRFTVRARAFVSNNFRKVLRCLLKSVGDGRQLSSLMRLLLYRPLLSVFLILRVLADMWSSMFIEVSFLCFVSISGGAHALQVY